MPLLLLGMDETRNAYISNWMWCFQTQKSGNSEEPKNLEPFWLPTSIWIDASMDFITCIPKSGNKSFIMVVMDWLSKYTHFCVLLHLFTPSLVAQVFMDQIFKLHGRPTSIVYDHDPTFTSNYLQWLFKLLGTQLQMSTTYHPHKDGQPEVVKKYFETYIWCFPLHRQHQWV